MHVFKGNPLGRDSIHDPLIHYVVHNIAPNKVVGLKAHIYETSYTKNQRIWCGIDPRARGYISAIYFDGIDGPPKAGGASIGPFWMQKGREGHNINGSSFNAS